MKKLILSAILICIAVFSYAQVDTVHYDFRKTKWGKSKLDVMKTELGKPTQTLPDAIHYKVKVGGFDATLVYGFRNNKLYEGTYMFDNVHNTEGEYLISHAKIKRLLTEKYDVPIRDFTKWFDKLFHDDPDKYGLAVKLGHLAYLATWEDGYRTTIDLMLRGGDNQISMTAFYYDKKVRAKVEEENDAEEAEGL